MRPLYREPAAIFSAARSPTPIVRFLKSGGGIEELGPDSPSASHPGLLNTFEPLVQSSGIKLPTLDEFVAAAGGVQGVIDPALLRQYSSQVAAAADQASSQPEMPLYKKYSGIRPPSLAQRPRWLGYRLRIRRSRHTWSGP